MYWSEAASGRSIDLSRNSREIWADHTCRFQRTGIVDRCLDPVMLSELRNDELRASNA